MHKPKTFTIQPQIPFPLHSSNPFHTTKLFTQTDTHTQLKTTNIHSPPHTHSLSASHTYTALTHSPPHTHSLNVKHTQMQYGITHMQTHMMLFFVHFIQRHLREEAFQIKFRRRLIRYNLNTNYPIFLLPLLNLSKNNNNLK